MRVGRVSSAGSSPAPHGNLYEQGPGQVVAREKQTCNQPILCHFRKEPGACSSIASTCRPCTWLWKGRGQGTSKGANHDHSHDVFTLCTRSLAERMSRAATVRRPRMAL